MRAQAVCKAWRSYLDPRQWPIQILNLHDLGDAEVRSLTAWVATLQPAVRSLNPCPKTLSVKVAELSQQLLYATLSISPRTVGCFT